ncbi:PKD domain-containing protein [Candidatus Pacearchaeota archaeon]|nr:PKD domain-containing protein [Candidatus Pacearchaeota archaeon]
MKRVFLSFLLLVLILNFTSASFQTGNKSAEIETKYSVSDFIKGWVNMSFSNQAGDSLFQDSQGNSIKLVELLDLNEINYTCSPSDCAGDYSASNMQSEKTFTLNKNDVKIIGFKFLGGNFDSVSGFSMKVNSNAGESEMSQLYVDILNDEELEWYSYKPSNTFNTANYGCYTTPDEEVFIYNQPYCNKINLSLFPNVQIGAKVTNATGGNVTFEMGICTEDFTTCEYCQTSTNSSGEISCNANLSTGSAANYFVCINTKNSTYDDKYKINSETTNSCGYASSTDYKRDFEIFARPGKYSSVGNFVLNDTELQNHGSYVNIEEYVREYISKFNSNCTNGCVVPVKFGSNADLQEITLSNVNIVYTSAGTPKEIKSIYDVTEIAPKISTELQKLFLNEANFSVKGTVGQEIDYDLEFSDKEILSQSIIIEKIPEIKSLNTKVAIGGSPTNFIAGVDGIDPNITILTYEWDFGDNTQLVTTLENKVTHTYSLLGNFTLTVTIKDANFNSSKAFNISVLTPKDAINLVLQKKQGDLTHINSRIQNFSAFQQSSLKTTLNLTETEAQLSLLQQQNQAATSDEQYINIMSSLIGLNVPKEIYESQAIGPILTFPDKDTINIDALATITGEGYSGESTNAYVNGVVAWGLNKTTVRVSESEISAEYEDFTESALKTFKIEINENPQREESYLIMNKLDNIVFKENYGQQDSGEYVYIQVPKEGRSIELSTTEETSFENLPMFISPKLSELPKTTINISPFIEKISERKILILSAIFALIIGFIAYLVLQEWYKRRYESYLFKNRNDLFNLVSYIENANRKNTPSREIEAKLKKSGWTGEQVSYVMRKYVGKRTGMLEIPISKLFDLFKKSDIKKT